MKFMLIRRADANTENGALPSQEMLAAMAAYNQRMIQAGVFISGNGLRPTSDGCLIRSRIARLPLFLAPYLPQRSVLQAIAC